MRLESVWEMGVEFMSRDSFIREVMEISGYQRISGSLGISGRVTGSFSPRTGNWTVMYGQ